MLTLYGENLGMSQHFDESGDLIPVTVVKCGPCTVVQKKGKEKEGYSAVQLGYGEVGKVQRINRPRKGHFQRAKTPVFRHLGECKLSETDILNVGDNLRVDLFQVGDRLNIRGRTKGRGFQGVIKRHGKSGGGASHGSHFHRAPGSIGMCTDPARVIKNMKLPGHMGAEFRTVKNLKVVGIDVENSLLFVKGAVPGSKKGLLRITNPLVKLEERYKASKKEGEKEKEKEKEESVEEVENAET